MTSRVLRALREGGSVRSVARRAQVDPDLVRLAIDHRERLQNSCSDGGCPAMTPQAAVPVGCRGCPLMSVRRM